MRSPSGGPRVLLRRLRETMAEQVSAQEQLDKIVVLIAANMVAEACSTYVMRIDNTLELYATEGLNRHAVHRTILSAHEGLVGLVASEAKPLNLSDAQNHPAFSFRPETGEEIYRSFLGVPILRAGNMLGVLVVQNRQKRTYVEEEIEALQTTAMVLAELIASGKLSAPSHPKTSLRLPQPERQGVGPHFAVRDDGVVDFAPPAAIDSVGNNIAHLRTLHPIMRELARNLVETLGYGNVPHSNLYERANSYLSLIDKELEEISFALLYIEGVQLENIAQATSQKVAEGELPSLNIKAGADLNTLLTLHGTFVLSTADGLALLGAEERYERRPHEEFELQDAILEFAKHLRSRPDIVAPAAAAVLLNSAEDLGMGLHPERSAIAAVSTAKNAAIVIISGATLGALPVVGSLAIGSAGLVGGGLAALIEIEGLKKTKSFLAVSGIVKDSLDHLSETDLQEIVIRQVNKLAPYTVFVTKMDSLLRRLASSRKEFSWMTESLDWLRERVDRPPSS